MYVRVYKEKVCSVRVCEKTEKKKDMLGRKLMDYLKVFQCGWSSGHFVLLFFFFSFSFSKNFKMAVLAPPPSACVHNSLRCKKRKKVSLAADDNGHEPTHPSISIIIYTFGLSILRLVSFFPPFFRFPLFFRDFGRDVRKRERKKK